MTSTMTTAASTSAPNTLAGNLASNLSIHTFLTERGYSRANGSSVYSKEIPAKDAAPRRPVLVHSILAPHKSITEAVMLMHLRSILKAYDRENAQKKDAEKDKSTEKDTKKGSAADENSVHTRYGVSIDCILDVFQALLHFVRTHSNRVWPGIKRIRVFCEQNSTYHGETAIKAAIKWLKKFVVKVLTQDERSLGPGPHRWPSYRRKNELRMETNCYELTAEQLLPEEEQKVVNAIIRGIQDGIEELSIREKEIEEKGADAAVALAAPSGHPLAAVRAEPEVDETSLWPDPFAISIGQPADLRFPAKRSAIGPQSLQSPGSSSSYLYENTLQKPPANNHSIASKTTRSSCNVSFINKAGVKRANDGGAGAGGLFSGRKYDSLYKERSFALKLPILEEGLQLPKTEAEIELVEAREKAHHALSNIHPDHAPVGIEVQKEMMETWGGGLTGAQYALKLAHYGEWRMTERGGLDERGDRIQTIAGYLNRTWKRHIRDKKANWHPDFTKWRARQKRLSAQELAATYSSKKERSAKPALRAAIPEGWFTGVPDAEARDCIQRAILFFDSAGEKPNKRSIKVRDRARHIWEQDHKGKTPPWVAPEEAEETLSDSELASLQSLRDLFSGGSEE